METSRKYLGDGIVRIEMSYNFTDEREAIISALEEIIAEIKHEGELEKFLKSVMPAHEPVFNKQEFEKAMGINTDTDKEKSAESKLSLNDIKAICGDTVNPNKSFDPWLPLLSMLCFSGFGGNNNNDSYYRGKADAYEKIFNDMKED